MPMSFHWFISSSAALVQPASEKSSWSRLVLIIVHGVIGNKYLRSLRATDVVVMQTVHTCAHIHRVIFNKNDAIASPLSRYLDYNALWIPGLSSRNDFYDRDRKIISRLIKDVKGIT